MSLTTTIPRNDLLQTKTNRESDRNSATGSRIWSENGEFLSVHAKILEALLPGDSEEDFLSLLRQYSNQRSELIQEMVKIEQAQRVAHQARKWATSTAAQASPVWSTPVRGPTLHSPHSTTPQQSSSYAMVIAQQLQRKSDVVTASNTAIFNTPGHTEALLPALQLECHQRIHAKPDPTIHETSQRVAHEIRQQLFQLLSNDIDTLLQRQQQLQ